MNNKQKQFIARELVKVAKDLTAADLPPEMEKLQKPFGIAVNKVLDGIDDYREVMRDLGRMRDYPAAERIGKRGETTARKMEETWNAIMDDFVVLRREMDDWRDRIGDEQ